MKRVSIIGCPGCGKSMFAGKLREKTGLPLYHLDNIWWKSDRTHVSREAFDTALKDILNQNEWIIDGNYHRTMEMRIKACDTVIFLDFDEQTCMGGIRERVGKARPDMPWTESSLDPELVTLVKGFRTEQRPEITELLDRYADKEIIVFRDRGEADRWLSSDGAFGNIEQ